MMPSYRFTGQTFALGCGSTQGHAPVLINTSSVGSNDQQNYAAFTNPASTGVVAVILTPGNVSSGAVTAFPADGTPTSGITFVLPPLMQEPMVVATPGPSNQGFWASGISNIVGTTTIFITPCSSQS